MKSFLQFASEETIRSKFNIKLVDKVIEGMRFHVWCTEWVFPPHKYANLAFRLYRNFVEKKIAQQSMWKMKRKYIALHTWHKLISMSQWLVYTFDDAVNDSEETDEDGQHHNHNNDEWIHSHWMIFMVKCVHFVGVGRFETTVSDSKWELTISLFTVVKLVWWWLNSVWCTRFLSHGVLS